MQNTLPSAVDVLVVGGGPAGLAAAIAARQHGLSVLVADGAAPPIDKACGEGLMPDGIEALRELGVTIPEQQAQRFRGIRFVNGKQRAEAVFPRGEACGVRRTVLHELLIERAAASGVELAWRSPVAGVDSEGAMVGQGLVRARWIVGADGTGSRVRRWAGLDERRHNHVRYAFRRHYRVRPWTDLMELHWGRRCQIYVTAVGDAEVCVAMVSEDSRLRLEAALGEFPELRPRLEYAEHTSTERGAVTVSRKLRRVYKGTTALIGDASGGVDSITGEGLCLAFRQAALLGECLAAGDLARYHAGHARLMRRPELMARLMLFMAGHEGMRRRAMRVFEVNPRCFAGMLAMHVGGGSARNYLFNGAALGWRLLGA
jgi:flavin-dependent dehydrogenase